MLTETRKEFLEMLAINGLTKEEALEVIDEAVEGRNVDIIIGGPPCQAFSSAGRAKDDNGMKNDPRNYLFESYVRILNHYEPKLFVFENVTGILTARPEGNKIIEKIVSELGEKYKVVLNPELNVFNTANYGVPQIRKRVILIGVRKDLVELFLKRLNNTELGNTGTNDSYILIPKNCDVSDIFVENEYISFTDKENGTEYNVRYKSGSEQRLNGLGKYYNDKQLSAGDEILFEKDMTPTCTKYWISYYKLKNSVVLQKHSTRGYEVLTKESLPLITDKVIEKESGLHLKYELGDFVKKRKDSPDKTQYYNFFIGDKKNCFGNTDKLVVINVAGDLATINDGFIWKRFSFVIGD